MNSLTSFFIIALSCILAKSASNETEVVRHAFCRDRFGSVEVQAFEYRSCALCFSYLFQYSKPFILHTSLQYLRAQNDSLFATQAPILADVRNASSVSLICASLSNDECTRWKACCEAARSCCAEQRITAGRDSDTSNGQTMCEATWDGYSCWRNTNAGVTATGACPNYIGHSITTRMAVKRCNPNGTWYQKSGYDWTDYTSCLDKEGYLIGVYLSLACCIVSVCLLVPAIIIFITFRDLHRQHRVRLHENFFLALTLDGIVNILWYSLVHYNLLSQPTAADTVLYKNPTWCRLLSFAKIFFTSAGYFWMFCEGYYLHRLISNAFEPPKSLLPLYLLGWGVPSIPCIVYGVIRVTMSNARCWVFSYGSYEWLIYAPNLICLIANLAFVGDILRILLFQMHSHPHEPSNFRRGLKAVFMLTPLFGLQLFVRIYRPPPGAPGEKEYEYFNFIVKSSQGVFVSLIFCLFNGEVLAHLRRVCHCSGRQSGESHTGQATQMTQVWTADDVRVAPKSPLLAKRPTTADDRNGSAMRDVELQDMTQCNSSSKYVNSAHTDLLPRRNGDYFHVSEEVGDEISVM